LISATLEAQEPLIRGRPTTRIKKTGAKKKDAVRHFRLGVHIVEERTVGCVRRKGRGLQYA
jgi:hypothetical protein